MRQELFRVTYDFSNGNHRHLDWIKTFPIIVINADWSNMSPAMTGRTIVDESNPKREIFVAKTSAAATNTCATLIGNFTTTKHNKIVNDFRRVGSPPLDKLWQHGGCQPPWFPGLATLWPPWCSNLNPTADIVFTEPNTMAAIVFPKPKYCSHHVVRVWPADGDQMLTDGQQHTKALL